MVPSTLHPFIQRISTNLDGLTPKGRILGEYIGRLYDEAKGRPLYVVSEAPED